MKCEKLKIVYTKWINVKFVILKKYPKNLIILCQRFFVHDRAANFETFSKLETKWCFQLPMPLLVVAWITLPFNTTAYLMQPHTVQQICFPQIHLHIFCPSTHIIVKSCLNIAVLKCCSFLTQFQFQHRSYNFFFFFGGGYFN